MTQSASLDKSLRQALDAARGELASVEAEFVHLASRINDLAATRQRLNALVVTLREALGISGEDEDQAPLPAAAASLGAAAGLGDGDASPLPSPPGGRGPKPDSAVYRAALVLRDSKRPMSGAEVVDEFKRRDWIESKWTGPDANVAQALQRTVKWGWGRKVSRGVFEWAGDQPEPGESALGGPRADMSPSPSI